MRQITAWIVLPLLITIIGPVGLEATHQGTPRTLDQILKGVGGRPREVRGNIRNLVTRIASAEPLERIGAKKAVG